MVNKMRFIPPINELLNSKEIQEYRTVNHLTTSFLKQRIQKVVAELREKILNDECLLESREEAQETIKSELFEDLNEYISWKLEPVINATGTVLHTNLGRARLSDQAAQQVMEVARHYSTLEYNTNTGERGSRHDLVEEYIKDLTGAEAALVVNNNAASVYMVLTTFAKQREVIVSRGELVEIGGSFRVSSIMEESGAILKEVGTTNKTHLQDYEQALNDHTSMIMKVHTSNFHIMGFTEEVSRDKLVNLADKYDVVTYEDLGSGMVYDLTQHSIGKEPLIYEVIDAGIDLVSFSGDKLFGGPQVGIIAGKKQYIDQLKKHQLARVLRVDKMNYAALEATLKQWILNDTNIPTLRDILVTKKELQNRVQSFLQSYVELGNQMLILEEVPLFSKVGGGTLPEVSLDSYGVSITSEKFSAKEIKDQLRHMRPRIIVRIENERVFLDFRTITPEEESIILKKLVEFS